MAAWWWDCMTLICLWIIVHLVSGKLLAGEQPGFLRLPLASPIQAVIIFIFHTSGLSLRNVARAGIPLWVVGASTTGKPHQLCSEMQCCPGSPGASLDLVWGWVSLCRCWERRCWYCPARWTVLFIYLLYVVQYLLIIGMDFYYFHIISRCFHTGVELVCKHWGRALCLIPPLALATNPVTKPFPNDQSLCSEDHTAWILSTWISQGILVRSFPCFLKTPTVQVAARVCASQPTFRASVKQQRAVT